MLRPSPNHGTQRLPNDDVKTNSILYFKRQSVPEKSHSGINSGLEFRQKIYLSDGQVDLQNHLSVIKSTCPTQENHKIKRLFNVALSPIK